MIERKVSGKCLRLSEKYPAVTITGPLQSGKTTLVKHIFPEKPYLNLEDTDVRNMAIEDPRGFLAGGYPDGAVLDEVQRVPELISYIQGIVDSAKKKGYFILTGSQQFELVSAINQSLAGRTAMAKYMRIESGSDDTEIIGILETLRGGLEE